jgi:hypothetical protein
MRLADVDEGLFVLDEPIEINVVMSGGVVVELAWT